MRSRVTPGVSRTIALRLPIRRLKRVDFPTFGRPTTATTGSRTDGAPSRPRGRPAEQAVDESAGARLDRPDRHSQVPREVGRSHVVEEDALRLRQRHARDEDHVPQRAAVSAFATSCPVRSPATVIARPKNSFGTATTSVRSPGTRSFAEQAVEDRPEQLAGHDRRRARATPPRTPRTGGEPSEVVLEPAHQAHPVLDDGEPLVRLGGRDRPPGLEVQLVRREDEPRAVAGPEPACHAWIASSVAPASAGVIERSG